MKIIEMNLPHAAKRSSLDYSFQRDQHTQLFQQNDRDNLILTHVENQGIFHK